MEGKGNAMTIQVSMEKVILPGMLVRPFKLNRTKTRTWMIHALGRVEYVDYDILATMPTDGPNEGEMYFFLLKKFTPVSKLSSEFTKRGLVPHYMAQIQVNINDPAFADEHPNGMQWRKDYCVAFSRWDGERGVNVSCHNSVWSNFWWFGGVPKSAPSLTT